MTASQILIVEDEWELANFIAEVVQGLGYGIIGPVARLDRNLHLPTTAPIDAAILDINIRGGNELPDRRTVTGTKSAVHLLDRVWKIVVA
jgi:DNA-binding response OmpR family regulator